MTLFNWLTAPKSTRETIRRENLRRIFADAPWRRPAGIGDHDRNRLTAHRIPVEN